MKSHEITVRVDDRIPVKGNLRIPSSPSGFVIFSHGSGSSRFSPRNRHVAEVLNDANIATLLVDLLTVDEDKDYMNRFNIDLLTNRLVAVTEHCCHLPELKDLPAGYFGASTGAASALNAAAQLPDLIRAVVSRGGRPDLAERSLPRVKAPTLLIVGSLDTDVIMLNKHALAIMACEKQLHIVPGAGHLFEEGNTLDEVARLATQWFTSHMVLYTAEK